MKTYLKIITILIFSILAVSCSSAPQGSTTMKVPEWKVTSTGLKYIDLIEGTGETAKSGKRVIINYTGTLENGAVFDRSSSSNPLPFTIGNGEIISGIEEGITGMQVGGKRKLVIPPALGYGERGAGGGKIPPNATLYFEIELVAVK
ncbi:MAG: fbp [Ignavibacteria bacterium]|nr:fbp [Ignavibacteria bacterium]